jgi:hypothetical protein
MKRRQFIKTGIAGAMGVALCTARLPWFLRNNSLAASPTAWRFGVISDTQWNYADPNILNPNTVAVSIIEQVNQKYIDHGCEFVVAVGDLGDNATTIHLETRAVFAQRLYNAGIGFYPLRGNHDESSSNAALAAAMAAKFVQVFPQTQTGMNNQTPAAMLSDPAVIGNNVAPVNTNGIFQVGRNFSSPVGCPAGDYTGLSYAFDHENARIIILDQFTPVGGYQNGKNMGSSIAAQQSWINSTLSARDTATHAFVFAHKGLSMPSQAGNLFSAANGNPSQNKADQDAFSRSMYENNGRIMMIGHDHMHFRSIITTTEGQYPVMQITTASDSRLFLGASSNPPDKAYTGSKREKPLSTENNTIGYYIYTVDGPWVTVEYYGAIFDMTRNIIVSDFTLRDKFGYSLNGQQFIVGQGESYACVLDNYGETSAEILSGVNLEADRDRAGRKLIKAVNTGWRPRVNGTASDILSLWGLTDGIALISNPAGGYRLPSATDPFALRVSYNPKLVRPSQLIGGKFCLSSGGDEGSWFNAVDLNSGGVKRFVYGPWKSSYELGSYGVDPKTSTVWAVVNHEGDFCARYLG